MITDGGWEKSGALDKVLIYKLEADRRPGPGTHIGGVKLQAVNQDNFGERYLAKGDNLEPTQK